ncbi:MAG TPA: hypothetical protein VGN86_05835, partial [Pyrinomonadaceae bacterium]|nr:hypothetical protein [Pyrinomonadaceae bacterium]
ALELRTIEASRYPEHLIIQRHSDKEIEFRPEGDRLRKDIEMIYVCKFTRVVPGVVIPTGL